MIGWQVGLMLRGQTFGVALFQLYFRLHVGIPLMNGLVAIV